MAASDELEVLLLEDEEDLATVFALWLREEHSVRTAHTGQAAREAMDEDVDVALLDRRLPRTTGDEVLASFREEGYEQPVAMVSAVAPDVAIADLPFDAYLEKPTSREELVETVQQLGLLADYDDRRREAFEVAQKVATIEAATTAAEREGREAYARLADRFDELRNAGQVAMEEMLPETRRATFDDRAT